MADVHSLILKSDSTQIRKSGKDLDSLSTSAKKTESSTNKLTESNKKASGSFNGLAKSVFAVSSAIGTGYLIKQYVDYADTMTQLDSQLKLVTDSTAELISVQNELFLISQESRTGFQSTVELYAKIARNTKDLNVPNSELLRTTETISKAMTISGGSAESMNAAIVQLSQGFASGTLRGEELNSVMEQTPRLAEAIAEGMGKSLGELRALGAEGKLTATAVMESLRSQASIIDSEFASMTITVDQSMTQVNNSTLQLVGNIDDVTGATESLSSMFTGFSSILDGLNTRLKDYTDNISNVHDIHRLTTLGDAERELQQLKDAYTENVESGVGFFESTQAHNAELKNQEFLITSLIRKIERLKEEKIDLSAIETAGGKSAYVASEEDFEMMKENGFKALASLHNQSAENEKERIADRKKGLNDLNALSLQLMEDEAKERERVNDALAAQMAGTIADAIQTGLEGGNLIDFASNLGVSMGNAMAQQAIAQMITSGVTSGNLVGLGVGVGAMAIGSLLSADSGDGESQVEKAEREFDTFISGLNKASQALEDFGNVGSSIELQLTEHLSKIEKQQNKIDEIIEKGVRPTIGTETTIEQTDFEKLFGLKGTKVVTTEISMLETQEDFEKRIQDQQDILNKHMEEIGQIIAENLASTLDISKLTVSQLENLTSSIDVSAAEAMAAELNNLALQAKVSGGALADSSRAVEILTNTNFIAYQNNTEALELLNEAEEERLEILERSQANIDNWNNSFKTADQLVVDLASGIATFSEETRKVKGFEVETDMFGNVVGINETLVDVLMTVESGTVAVANTMAELQATFDELSESGGELTDVESEFLLANKALLDARENERVSLQTRLDLLTGAVTQRELELASIDDTNKSIQEAIYLEQDKQKLEADRIKLLKDEKTETEKMIESQQDNIKKITSLVQSEMLGTLSYLDDAGKLAYANNILATSASPEDRISSSRAIAEISRGTTRTREDYAPIFAEYLSEVQKQADEATTQDLVDKLDEIKEAIEESADSATGDAIYGT